ncbi:15-hydroxyprostaglandin dehydrogenase [Pyrenophora tritici-repentis]|nr:15-hydroxyprostaglandin dehydrogenase [Pyrenophora tritici-repentis]
MQKKVALITGGASGMGLGVAEALSSHPTVDWDVHLFDLNKEAGQKASSELKNAHFHETSVTDYDSLVSAFEVTWNTHQRIDFVFANAGIVERDNFYKKHDLDGPPPPPPNQLSVDINLKGVINTAHLALHYFRKSLAKNGREGLDPVLIMTASCGGLYPSEFCPMYSASKAGIVNFNRAITMAYHHEGIRTFATCPGTIKTPLLTNEEWKSFPERFFTPLESLVETVVKLVDGGDIKDAKGVTKIRDQNWGLTVEVNGRNFYFRDAPEFCDENMKSMMVSTGMASQLARIEGTTSDLNM